MIDVQDTEKDLLLPAIHATTNILTAALKVPTIKSIVVTSSFASVVDVAYWDPNLDLTSSVAKNNPIRNDNEYRIIRIYLSKLRRDSTGSDF